MPINILMPALSPTMLDGTLAKRMVKAVAVLAILDPPIHQSAPPHGGR